jgi:4,5-dihydroxyphthalate decarboxylase
MGLPSLKLAIGNYPHVRALRDGRVTSERFALEFADIAPISRAFAPMVREARFDVSEMAIATFLQAKAAGKDLVLLPVVMAARFQEEALLCCADSDIAGPQDLVGRRVGVRAYSQTTGLWLRGILAEEHGVAPERIRWVTFEDAHVAEYRDPPWAERAQPGQDMLAMLHAGELDAAIFGNEKPADTTLRTVFPDPVAAAQRFLQRHGGMPINHMVVVRQDLIAQHPALVPELLRLFTAAGTAAPPPPWPTTRMAMDPMLELALRYVREQRMLPAPLDAGQIWDGLPAAA